MVGSCPNRTAHTVVTSQSSSRNWYTDATLGVVSSDNTASVVRGSSCVYSARPAGLPSGSGRNASATGLSRGLLDCPDHMVVVQQGIEVGVTTI
jgi:hypothetical protein